MNKLLKSVLKWRERYYTEKIYANNADAETIRLKKKLNLAYSRYDDSIRHNVYLAKEIDNQYKMIKELEAKLKETTDE